MEWQSREGKTYLIRRAASVDALSSSPETFGPITITSGGVGPFLEALSVFVLPGSAEPLQLYRLEVLP